MKKLLFSYILCFLSLAVTAQRFTTNQELLHEFQDMKFGMFVHWGPVSLKGTEIGWSRGEQVSVDEYDNLYKQFNPTQFNADEWLQIAKDAGMKYFIITSRHHDGFNLWPTEYSDYDISATPYKKDVLMNLKNACDRHGIVFGTYYSICDWRHPLYPLGSPGGKTTKNSGDMEKYLPYIQGQTREILEKYQSKILWFDGEWEEPWTHEMGLDFYQYLKGIDPDILINNRVDKGRNGMEGVTLDGDFAGDYATPEQRVGTFDNDHPWESCITICRQWSWKPNDKLKSLDECLTTLIKTVGGGGNLLLNVGPMPDGRIEPRQAERLREIGQWLSKNGEAIYGTKGGPYKPTDELASTRKGNNIYLHVLINAPKSISIPFPYDAALLSCSWINGKKVKYTKSANSLVIDLPGKNQDLPCVLKLTLDTPAENLESLQLE
jgi:alpha-L-fucosidase